MQYNFNCVKSEKSSHKKKEVKVNLYRKSAVR